MTRFFASAVFDSQRMSSLTTSRDFYQVSPISLEIIAISVFDMPCTCKIFADAIFTITRML